MYSLLYITAQDIFDEITLCQVLQQRDFINDDDGKGKGCFHYEHVLMCPNINSRLQDFNF